MPIVTLCVVWESAVEYEIERNRDGYIHASSLIAS
jgi:hypothetical protein